MLIMGLVFQPLIAQEKPLKDLVENARDRKYTFYASTLRMVNLNNDPTYNELVNGIEKVLVYQLDSTAIAEKREQKISEAYQAEGFEEYATIFGGAMQLSLLGLEEAKYNQFVGYVKQDSTTYAFYLRGKIAWNKVPPLMNKLQEIEVFNLFDQKF